jgi:formamidopyrimidine-DNA glycosylase
MPELPEVETIKIGLSKLLLGHEITDVEYDWQKSFPNAKADVNNFLIGAKVQGIRRRAKVLLIDLDTNYTLVIHLKMTGQIVYVKEGDNERFGAGHPTESLIQKLPDRSTRVIIKMDGATLFFNDQRKFGWVRLMPTLEVENLDFFRKVGPEPLGGNFDPNLFIERVRRRTNSTIKAVLLDQTVIAGVGNIYADESLWGAEIHPATRVYEISDDKLKLLFTELQFVLRLSIEKGGSTDKNYVDAEGKKGSYMNFARVFRREGQFCPRCKTIIEKTRVASRGTHFCPTCQVLK